MMHTVLAVILVLGALYVAWRYRARHSPPNSIVPQRNTAKKYIIGTSGLRKIADPLASATVIQGAPTAERITAPSSIGYDIASAT